jgi:hypothetical protein
LLTAPRAAYPLTFQRNVGCFKSSLKRLRSVVLPWATLPLQQVYGGLDELKRFGIPNPNHFKARLLTSVLNPNDVTQAHVSADTGQQSATSANAGGDDLLREALPSLVSAVYRYDEAFICSKLTALFHGFSKALPECSDTYAKNRQRVGWQSASQPDRFVLRQSIRQRLPIGIQ